MPALEIGSDRMNGQVVLASGVLQRGQRFRISIQGHYARAQLGCGQGVATTSTSQVEDGASSRCFGQTR